MSRFYGFASTAAMVAGGVALVMDRYDAAGALYLLAILCAIREHTSRGAPTGGGERG